MTQWTQEDAMSALDPHFDEIDTISRGGLEFYRQYPPNILIEHDNRAAANNIYAHMVAIARVSCRRDHVLIEERETVQVCEMPEHGLRWCVGRRCREHHHHVHDDGGAGDDRHHLGLGSLSRLGAAKATHRRT